MVERKQLTMIWRQGANAPWRNLLSSLDGLGYATYQYTVDGSPEEALLWVEGVDTPRLADEGGVVFRLTLAREVGARLEAVRRNGNNVLRFFKMRRWRFAGG